MIDRVPSSSMSSRLRSSPPLFLDIKLARLVDQMVKPFDSDLHDIVFGVVDETDERHPFRLYLIAKVERRNLDLGLFSGDPLRNAVEKRSPFCAFQLARHLTISIAMTPILGNTTTDN